MKDFRILLTTSDGYIGAVLPYAWLLKKYWPDHPDVVVGGFALPDFQMPPGFSFLSLGDQKDFPLSKWSDMLYNFLTMVDDEVFMFTLEDMWVIEPVKVDVVKRIYDYMMQFRYVIRFDLTGDRLHAGGSRFYGMLGDDRIIWAPPGSPYHMSTMPALWRKEHLLKVLIPNETPWDLEISGTTRLSNMSELLVVGTDAWPLRNTLAFRSGDVSRLLLDEVDAEDVKAMRSMDLLKGLE